MKKKAIKSFAGSHNIPASFWADVTPEEIGEICDNDSCLTPRLKERLFRMLDIQDPPKGELRIEVYMPDARRRNRK